MTTPDEVVRPLDALDAGDPESSHASAHYVDVLRRAAAVLAPNANGDGIVRISAGWEFFRAVSDLLEETAAWQDEGLGTCPEINQTNYPDAVASQFDAALNVARAVLGGNEPRA